MNAKSSPTRRYMAMIQKINSPGYCFQRFELPLQDPDGRELENDTRAAKSFYLRHVNVVACVETCLTAEDYEDQREVVTCTQCRVVNNLHEAGCCNERRRE